MRRAQAIDLWFYVRDLAAFARKSGLHMPLKIELGIEDYERFKADLSAKAAKLRQRRDLRRHEDIQFGAGETCEWFEVEGVRFIYRD